MKDYPDPGIFVGRRVRKVAASIDEVKIPVLDIGPPNEFSRLLCEKLKIFLPLLHNTVGDLNLDTWQGLGHSKMVWCFEVVEHLMSPRMFLERLKKFIDGETIIYLTYPRRIEFFWTRYHFHEYRRDKFLYMLDDAGYEVLEYKWWWRIARFHVGLRPILRLTPLGMMRTQFYKLKLRSK